MPTAPFDVWMDHSVVEVLESMCFLSAEEGPAIVWSHANALVSRRLGFRGPESGSFGIQTDLSTARLIACNLLGQEPEEVSDAQAKEVVGEVANMVCGAFLARFERTQAFDLTAPCLDHPLDESVASAGRISRSFLVEQNALVAWMEIEESK